MDQNIKICVIGLGYVGLPLSVLFAKKYKVIGFDINENRILELDSNNDKTLEISSETLSIAKSNGWTCTFNIENIKNCNVYIVAVPTPVDINNKPDLSLLINASRIVGSIIKPKDVVIYESTVYPGVTEEICVPQIELVSNLKYNKDFFVGYSPERVNPGDKTNTIENITKVTSGSTPEIASFIDNLYQSVIKAGTYKASSIKIAEAAKIIENAQRDVNIAFFNEIAKIFNAMQIDTAEVIEAASTKWNFIKMKPGLVGGHCISVDPYYLIQKAQVYGILPRIMSAARRLNDGMGDYVANQVIKLMNLKGLIVKNSNILLLGFTFKENCPDIRNTKVADIYATLNIYTPNIIVCDPICNPQKVLNEYKINVSDLSIDKFQNQFDAVILCTAHDCFLKLDVRSFLKDKVNGVVYDVKSVLDKSQIDSRL